MAGSRAPTGPFSNINGKDGVQTPSSSDKCGNAPLGGVMGLTPSSWGAFNGCRRPAETQ